MINLKAKPFYLSDEDIRWVTDTLNNMTEDEKIGQLFVFESKDCDAEKLRMKFDVIKPGGLMFRPNPLVDVKRTVRTFQEWSEVPMLMAANLCMGGSDIAMEGTLFATQFSVAATEDSNMAYRLGEVCGMEGAAAGVNWTYAPVSDVDMNFRSPITNTRTYGSDADRVRSMCREYIRGVQPHGVAGCMKHFPGDGVDERDQHLTVTVNSLTCEEWDATFGKIYQELIDEGVLTAMVGHITMPAYSKRLNPSLQDEDCLPGSLSKELMTDLLRGKLGFNGLIVTDDTQMAGFQIQLTREEAVPMSIAAGADMFLFHRVLEEDMEFMHRGLKSGILTVERLNAAVTRILALKACLGLHKKQKDGTLVPTEESESVFGCSQHKEWATECADRAITLVKNKQDLLPLSPEKYKNILVYNLSSKAFVRPGMKNNAPVKELSEYFIDKLKDEGFNITLYSSDFGIDMYSSVENIKKYDLILYFVNIRSLGATGMARIQWDGVCGDNSPVYGQYVPTIAVSMNSPYMLLDMPRVKTFINCYTPAPHFVDAVIEKLMGRSEFTGINPSDPWCGRLDTRL